MLFMTAVTLPPVFLFALSMTISNISLIRHERRRFSNMLGILSGIGLFSMIAVVVVTFILFVIHGSDEIISEGEAMKRYLLEQGIEEKYILAETNSTNTFENMRFSRELIESRDSSAKIAFSTTNYHVMRSGILAAKAGLTAKGMGAPTKWYFWPNALLREVVGLFAYQPRMQILVMLLLALLAGAAGYFYYLVM